jgi:hypothetical protein
MRTQEVTNVLESISAAGLLLTILFRLVPSVRLDAFRQQMFEIRDELFDYAASGNISFFHPAYRLLRQSMNGHLRYAHQLSLFRIIMTALEWSASKQRPTLEWTKKLETAINSIPDEHIRRDLNAFHHRALTLVFKRLVLGSPFLIAAVLLSMLEMILQKGLHNLRQAARIASASAINRIIDPRLIEEDAARTAA